MTVCRFGMTFCRSGMTFCESSLHSIILPRMKSRGDRGVRESMDKELLNRAETIQKQITQLRDSL